MRIGNGQRAGFSLIEVLITIFILGVVCITLISVFIYGFNLLQKTKKVAMATEIAQAEVERYRNTPYATIQALAVGTASAPVGGEPGPSRHARVFQRRPGLGDLREPSSGGDENIRKLTVQITLDVPGTTAGEERRDLYREHGDQS